MTIYDIAKFAGVSASTVSRVINNKPGVKAETKRKVQKLLDEKQFQLDENARGLSTNITKLVGILIADIRNAHYTELAYAIEFSLLKQGYCSIIVNTGSEFESIQSSIRMLKQRKVDGVIIIGSIFQNEYMKNAISQFIPDIPIVFASGYLELPNVYGILADEYQGIRNCVKLLHQRGYQQVAFAGRLHTISNRMKAEGYESAVLESGHEIMKVELKKDTFSECLFEPLDELLSKYSKVDAIIFSNDYLAGEAMNYLRNRNINVPDEMGIIGVNNDRYCKICYPTITSLDNKMSEMGLMAATTLLDLLKGKERVKRVMIFSEIIERESIRRFI